MGHPRGRPDRARAERRAAPAHAGRAALEIPAGDAIRLAGVGWPVANEALDPPPWKEARVYRWRCTLPAGTRLHVLPGEPWGMWRTPPGADRLGSPPRPPRILGAALAVVGMPVIGLGPDGGAGPGSAWEALAALQALVVGITALAAAGAWLGLPPRPPR